MPKKQYPTKVPKHRTNAMREQRNCMRDVEQEYLEFKNQYPRSGAIRVQSLTAQKTLPVQGTEVEIFKKVPSGIFVIDTQLTDESGLIVPVTLPALPAAQSMVPGISQPFTTFDIKLSKTGFDDVIIHDVPVYENLTTLQVVEMIPDSLTKNGSSTIEYTINQPPL